jgi:cyclase
MLQPRLIPALLVDAQQQLVKTCGFGSRHYLGDPLNAAYVFSGFEVDELLVLDIDASTQGRSIPLPFVEALASFTCVPLTVGGGVTSLEQIHKLLALGVEKVVLSAVLSRDFSFLQQAVARFGSSTISVILNVYIPDEGPALAWCGRPDAAYAGTGQPLSELALACQLEGAGELVIHSVELEGHRQGYAVALLSDLNRQLTIPLVALGGCGSHGHIAEMLLSTPLSGVAAGSLFVYAPDSQHVLLNYTQSHNWLQQQLPHLQKSWRCT